MPRNDAAPGPKWRKPGSDPCLVGAQLGPDHAVSATLRGEMSWRRMNLQQLRRGITPALRQEVLGDDEDAFCDYCGFPASEVDHIVPVSRGGGIDLENLTAACRECNSEKTDLSVAEWIDKRLAAGKPWPIPTFTSRLADLHRRREPWGSWPDITQPVLREWIAAQPGGYERLRQCIVHARDFNYPGGDHA